MINDITHAGHTRPGAAGQESAAVSDVSHSEKKARPTWIQYGSAIGLMALGALLVAHIVERLGAGAVLTLSGFYALVAGLYLLSRYVLFLRYREAPDVGYEPDVAVIVPAFNEGAGVAKTIKAIMSTDYPSRKIELIVVNDGSTDDTLRHAELAASEYPSGSIRILDLGVNQGKRAAMAAGIRATQAEVLVFVDSDSEPMPDAVRRLVQSLADPEVGCVSGNAGVTNSDANWVTRAQEARYFMSFELMKPAESALGAVDCCSGCFSAYRRDAVLEILRDWESQSFLGQHCTFGDDRSLTNMMIRAGWKSVYSASAKAVTNVPTRTDGFLRQQLRWKKSWVRESLLQLSHLWRSRPAAFPFAAAKVLIGFVGPAVFLLQLVAVATGQGSPVYWIGLALVILSSVLFAISQGRGDLSLMVIIGWPLYALLGTQVYWAVIRLRDTKWGTRAVDAGSAPDPSRQESLVLAA